MTSLLHRINSSLNEIRCVTIVKEIRSHGDLHFDVGSEVGQMDGRVPSPVWAPLWIICPKTAGEQPYKWVSMKVSRLFYLAREIIHILPDFKWGMSSFSKSI